MDWGINNLPNIINTIVDVLITLINAIIALFGTEEDGE
jgi:hypothetical protein